MPTSVLEADCWETTTLLLTFDCLSPVYTFAQTSEAQLDRIFAYYSDVSGKKGSSLQTSLYLTLLKDMCLLYKMHLNKSVP